MQVTQSWSFGNPNAGAGGGKGYSSVPVTLLVAASSDANPSVYAAQNNDAFIEADASSQNVEINLPAAAQSLGQIKTIKRYDATYASGNSVTIQDVSGASVEGLASLVLTAQNAVVQVQCDGTQWRIITGSNSAPWGSAAAIAAITVGASPFSYTAVAKGTVLVSGGTDSALSITRGSTTVAIGFTDGAVPVVAGDIVKVTYSAAPTMDFVPS